MAIEGIPARFLTPEMEAEFRKWLKATPLQAEDKKYLLLWWHKFLDLTMSREDVIEVIGP